jgi:hypothetical protein
MPPVRPVRGVQLVELDRHADSRGSLLHFGTDSPIPFEVRNVYFIVDCPPDATRAEHANSNDSAIIALSSAVTVEVDNGGERWSHRLTEPDAALVVRAGVWLRLREFSRETCVVVLSSKPWEETRHFDAPEPTLLDDAGL